MAQKKNPKKELKEQQAYGDYFLSQPFKCRRRHFKAPYSPPFRWLALLAATGEAPFRSFVFSLSALRRFAIWWFRGRVPNDDMDRLLIVRLSRYVQKHD